MNRNEYIKINNQACENLVHKLNKKYNELPKIILHNERKLYEIELYFHRLLNLKICVGALPGGMIEWYVNVNNGKTHSHELEDEILDAIEIWNNDDIIIESLWNISFKIRNKFLHKARKKGKFRLFYKIYDSKQIYYYKVFGRIIINNKVELK